MQIVEISINGFGHFHDVSVPAIGPGITVFEGHNEAGKTTLMAFIRAILFGFERKNSPNRYEPVRGGRYGGSLVLSSPEGPRYRIERVEGGAQGRAMVSDATGRRFDEEQLGRLLHRTSKLLYQNVFAFGIGELQRLETLQADEVSNYIYTVGMGAGLTPLASVLSALDAEEGLLFRPGGKKPAINALLPRLDDTQATIRELQTMPDEYNAIRERLFASDQEIAYLQGQLDDVKARGDWLTALVKAGADWEQLVLVRQELGEHTQINSFPEGGVERLVQLERAIAGLELRLDEIKRSLREAETARKELRIDARLLDQQDAIRALEELRGHYRGLLSSLPDLRARVDSRRKALNETIARLGPDWDDERLARFEASIPVRERIRGFRDRLATARQQSLESSNRQEEIEKARREKDSQLDRLQRNLEALNLPEAPSRATLEEREKAVRDWIHVSHQRDLVRQHHRNLEQQAETLSSQVKVQEAELQLLESQTGLPTWMIVVALLVFALPAGVAFYRQEPEVAVTLGVGGALMAALLLWWRERLAEQNRVRVADALDRYNELLHRVKALRAEQERTEEEAGDFSQMMAKLSGLVLGREEGSIEVVEEHLRALEAERRMAERRKDLETRIQDEEEALVRVLEEQERVRRNVELAAQALGQAEEGWADVLKGMGLPEELTPDGALEVLSSVERAQGQLGEWQDVAQELQRVEDSVREIHGRLNSVLGACGRELVGVQESAGAVLALRHGLTETLEAQAELERLSAMIGARQTERDMLLSERARDEEQRQLLLAAGGASDAEEFRKRAVLYKRQVELDRQSRQLETAIRVHAGAPDRSEDMEQALAMHSRSELERLLREAMSEQQPRLVEELTRKLQEKGRLEQQLHDMEQNERLSVALLEQQELIAQLEQHANKWAIRVIAQHLLQQARQIYERERQPAVLRQASEFFKQMTGGRYKRIIVPLGETRLQIEAADGAPLTTDQLSRGTAEQLYLAMRLAFVREYAKHAGPLPLVVDDILVNFDPIRAKAAILALYEISHTHQILVFTCHPHVRRWFEEAIDGVSVRSLPSAA